MRQKRHNVLAELGAPQTPWKVLNVAKSTGPRAYVSVYLSDSIARLPVRAVTKPRDNKSDPNLETGTYGLFSTCQIKMRKSIVTRGVPYIFFVTTHGNGEREVSGYYRNRWYAEGPDADYALAADEWRFVKPIPLSTLPRTLRDAVALRRGYRGLDEDLTQRLLDLLHSKPDWTARYLAEIARLETLSTRHTGFAYPTWQRKDSWSWADAATYLPRDTGTDSTDIKNTAPGDIWTCDSCSQQTMNKARLKRCPKCGAIATLRPLRREG